ncbi:MAG: SRPBCC family protein [Burkholderiaceae bacterium]|nr:SRPBCC family protein [Burkholderiaceae bacterium]
MDTTIAHGSFSIERRYNASPAQVYAAWSDIETKARWFIGPEGWTLLKRTLEFRVGGQEVLQGRLSNGMETLFTACFHHLTPNERIVYVYDMHLNGKHHSLSLATVEFTPAERGTRMLFTEQVAYLDGTDGAQGVAMREHGTAAHLDRLGRLLS